MTGVAVRALAGALGDPGPYGTVKFLLNRYTSLGDKMQVLQEDGVSGLLVQTGKNVYERSWTVGDTNSYHGELFSFFEYDARLDMEQRFDRKVTLRVVKS